MVVPESDMISHEEVESPLQQDQHTKITPFSSLPRQSSIYSLTLDEFQHTLCESGRNFGSMNMDEFLNSIWTAEENQAHAHAQGQTHITSNNNNYNTTPLFPMEGSNDTRPITKQVSLSRQGSLTLPAPLCRKTVDEVWSEIHRTRQEQQQQNQSNSGGGGGVNNNNNNMQKQGSTPTQPTFGEMTLEDFLVKAGVVREQCNTPPPAQPPSYGMFRQLSPPAIGPSYGPRTMVGNIPPYQPLGQSAQQHSDQVVYQGNRCGTGTGGYQTGGLSVPGVNYTYGLGGSPVSPQSDGMCGGCQIDGSNMYGMDTSGISGGRKRIIDGPIEKVVERRQRRMIKNRESAARSRARKQAYTVELEAELNQLKDENAQLKHALAELESKRKQQYVEDAKIKAQPKAQKAKERIQIMRRSFSCPV